MFVLPMVFRISVAGTWPRVLSLCLPGGLTLFLAPSFRSVHGILAFVIGRHPGAGEKAGTFPAAEIVLADLARVAGYGLSTVLAADGYLFATCFLFPP